MARWRMLAALLLTYVLFGILLNSVGTVILQSVLSFGVSKTQAGGLEALKDLPIAAVSFATASFLPRFGYRKAMLAGTAAVGVACLVLRFAPSFLATQLLFATVGCAFALVKVSVYSSIGLLAPDRRAHASLTTTIEGLFMVGVLAGYWLFSAFIDPEAPGDLGWLDVYGWLAALSAVTIALMWFSRLDESAARSPRSGAFQDFKAMLALTARPLVLIFVVSAFLYVLIEQAIGTWLPTFNNEVLRLPADMSVQAASIFAAGLAAGRLSAGAVLRRVDWYPVLIGCVLAMGVLVLLVLPLTRGLSLPPDVTWFNAPAAAYLLPLIGLFLAPIYPTLNSVMLTALPRSEHAAMTGLLVLFSALGGSTGSLITGLVFDRYDGQTAFYMSLVPMAALLFALALFRRLGLSGGQSAEALSASGPA